jgi:hypothetical protein
VSLSFDLESYPVVVLDSSRYIDGLFANDPPIEMEKDDVVG